MIDRFLQLLILVTMIIKLQNKLVQLTIDSLGCTLLSLHYLSGETWINTILSLKHNHYSEQDWYCGAIIGRFSNRIKNGIFELDGNIYHIPTADEGNALHGNHGLDRIDWHYKKDLSDDQKAVFTYQSADGEHGFPATIDLTFSISIKDQTVELDYMATPDQNTPLSLTHHPYFNLNENHGDDITNHKFKLSTSSYLELVDMIPTGNVLSTSKFDQHVKLEDCDYDDCFIVDNYRPSNLITNASIINNTTDIRLDILSDLPSYQFYTGKWIPKMTDAKGNTIGTNSGFCIEPEYYPNSPNQSTFPSCIFGPDRPYHHIIQYKFSKI